MSLYTLMQEICLVRYDHSYYYMEAADAAILAREKDFTVIPIKAITKWDLKEHVTTWDEFQNFVPNGKILYDYVDKEVLK